MPNSFTSRCRSAVFALALTACGSPAEPEFTYGLEATAWSGALTLPEMTVKVRPGTTTFRCTWQYTFEPSSATIAYGTASSAGLPVEIDVGWDYSFPAGVPEGDDGNTGCASGTRSITGTFVGTAQPDGNFEISGEVGPWDVTIGSTPVQGGGYTCSNDVLTAPGTIRMQYDASNIEGLEDWETLSQPLETTFTTTHSMSGGRCGARPLGA